MNLFDPSLIGNRLLINFDFDICRNCAGKSSPTGNSTRWLQGRSLVRWPHTQTHTHTHPHRCQTCGRIREDNDEKEEDNGTHKHHTHTHHTTPPSSPSSPSSRPFSSSSNPTTLTAMLEKIFSTMPSAWTPVLLIMLLVIYGLISFVLTKRKFTHLPGPSPWWVQEGEEERGTFSRLCYSVRKPLVRDCSL